MFAAIALIALILIGLPVAVLMLVHGFDLLSPHGQMRPYTLAAATISHGIASAALAGVTLWLASYAPDIRPLALPAYAATIGLAFAGTIGAASLCWQSLQQFARLMAAPLTVETMP